MRPLPQPRQGRIRGTRLDGRAMQRAAGFTLIEVLVSLLIFSFGVLGAVGMQAKAARFSTEASERDRAALLANELAATMWAQRTTSPDLTAWRARLADDGPNGFGLPSAELEIGAPDSQGAVTVTLTWLSVARGGTGSARGRYVTQVVLP